MTKIYLCGAVNGCSDVEATAWRESIKASLGEGCVCIDPMCRDYRGVELDGNNTKQIVENDLTDIQNSDIILYYYDKPSVGSAMEVFYASHVLNKQVIVINENNHTLSPWLVYHCNSVCKSLEEAVLHIKTNN